MRTNGRINAPHGAQSQTARLELSLRKKKQPLASLPESMPIPLERRRKKRKRKLTQAKDGQKRARERLGREKESEKANEKGGY